MKEMKITLAELEELIAEKSQKMLAILHTDISSDKALEQLLYLSEVITAAKMEFYRASLMTEVPINGEKIILFEAIEKRDVLESVLTKAFLHGQIEENHIHLRDFYAMLSEMISEVMEYQTIKFKVEEPSQTLDTNQEDLPLTKFPDD